MIINILLLFYIRNVVEGHPIHRNHQSEQLIIWKTPNVTVNVTSFSRGLIPILIPNNYSHKLPLKTIELADENGYVTVTDLKQTNVLKEVTQGIEQSLRTSISCQGCKAGIYFLKSFAARSTSNSDYKALKEMCANFNLLTADVCEGFIDRLMPELDFVLSRANFDVNEYCAHIVINDDCMGREKSRNENWEISLPSIPKPLLKPLKLPKENAPSFKVLHITDTHYDPLYTEGSSAVCKEPLCCRDKNQIVTKPSDAAGKWGDYRNCDPPKATIDNLFAHIVEIHPDIDYIIWTGDLQPHNGWSETKEENLSLMREMVTTMKQIFPNISIFPAIGNHDASPVNNFPQPYMTHPQFSNKWLLDEIDVLWRLWLPENVSPTIKYGGFYSVLVRPGFRIISINTNYCYFINFWMLLNATDPASQLQWLIYELQASELANEKVHIIGHIPTGYVDCMRIWSLNYYKIIARFESTVTGQFFGHTHGDEFEVYYDPDDLSRAINIAYISPSVSPYFDFNPGYKIFYVDGDHADTTRMVIDEEGWFFNLSDANIKGTPHWQKLYSARSSYGMDGLRPADWHKFINHMRTNDEIFDLYHKHYWRDSPKRPECDSKCKKEFICDARSGRSHDRKVLCEIIENNNYKQSSNGLFPEIGRFINSAAKFLIG